MKHTASASPPNDQLCNAATTVAFDWKDWLPYLADDDTPLDQKRELIETLWSIILTFVDLGYEVKSKSETCGEAVDLRAALEAAVLQSEDISTTLTSLSKED